MIRTVNFPTRLQNNHAPAADNVFVDESRLYSCIIFPLPNALSECLIFDKFFVTDNKNNNKLRNKCKSRLIACETMKKVGLLQALKYLVNAKEFYIISVSIVVT
jgi:hypothetical protein